MVFRLISDVSSAYGVTVQYTQWPVILHALNKWCSVSELWVGKVREIGQQPYALFVLIYVFHTLVNG